MEEKLYGNLIIIGGAEDKKRDKFILKEISNYIKMTKIFSYSSYSIRNTRRAWHRI